MADFKTAVLLTLQHEGGYVDNPSDHGRATKYGITQKDMPGVDIAALSEDEAVKYYSDHYWKPVFGLIDDQAITNKLFDMGVLFGIGEAAYLMQRALGFTPMYLSRVVDQYTLIHINAAVPGVLLAAFQEHLEAHAKNLAIYDSTQEQFLKGWLNRIDS